MLAQTEREQSKAQLSAAAKLRAANKTKDEAERLMSLTSSALRLFTEVFILKPTIVNSDIMSEMVAMYRNTVLDHETAVQLADAAQKDVIAITETPSVISDYEVPF